jgi:hypothetical protein
MLNGEVESHSTTARIFYIQRYLTDVDENSYKCSILRFTSSEFYVMSINETQNLSGTDIQIYRFSKKKGFIVQKFESSTENRTQTNNFYFNYFVDWLIPRRIEVNSIFVCRVICPVQLELRPSIPASKK